MSLRSDVTFFWRFAPILKFACSSWVAKPILDEARSEIESIAMHTRSPELAEKCFGLLRATSDLTANNTPAEQIVNDILGAIVSGKKVQSLGLPSGIKLATSDVQAFG